MQGCKNLLSAKNTLYPTSCDHELCLECILDYHRKYKDELFDDFLTYKC